MDFYDLRKKLGKKLAKNLNKVDSFRPIFKYIDKRLPNNLRKEATSESTRRLVQWAIVRDQTWDDSMLIKFFEDKFGWRPKWQDQQSDLRWEEGQKLIFEASNVKKKYAEPLNPVIREHDGKVGMVEKTEKGSRDLENDGKPPGDIIVDLQSGGKVRVPYGQKRQNSGLKTPEPGFAEEGKTKVEFVYFSRDEYKPTPERQKKVEDYVSKDDNRTRVYRSGYPMGGPKESKEGKIYLTVHTDQVGYTRITPSKGRLLYFGIHGDRPSGMEEDIQRWKDQG